jgi:flagellar biosynthesis protein FlhB
MFEILTLITASRLHILRSAEISKIVTILLGCAVLFFFTDFGLKSNNAYHQSIISHMGSNTQLTA